MSEALPEHIQPLRLAERGASLAGSVATTHMPRLAEMLHEPESTVVFELRFDRDDAGRGRVRGRIDATLVVVCQRCLAPMALRVAREVRLGLVRDDTQAAMLDADYDPLMVGEVAIPLTGLLEDELILAMPNFARHRPGECEMPPGADAVEDVQAGAHGAEDAGTTGEDNPFSVLESLKSRKSP